MKVEPPIVSFSTVDEWHSYLSKNFTNEQGVRLKLAKKGVNTQSVTHQEALEVSLMYGWIDGKAQTVDENYWLLKFTPRRAKSMWSKRNCDIVERLIKENKMQPSGLVQVEEAKKDGRWDRAYDSPKNMVIPEDFLKELKKDPSALEFFNTLNKTNVYAITWRLQTAKKPETREKRMKELLQMLKNKQKLH